MPRKRSRNPVGFTPWPVTFFIVASFAALFSSLIVSHNVVPSAPSDPTPLPGINITEAWQDLQYLTNGYHPYNSRRNDEVRNWLLQRIETIIKTNSHGNTDEGKPWEAPAIIFNDLQSNLTFGSPDSALSVSFAGSNIMVYIKGSEDPGGNWWDHYTRTKDTEVSKGGVLVNAHFDSVPSGYGATDDGVGVISVLQLVSYFTVPENRPRRGIVALLNNGEEDYLNGAYAFTQHPLSKFPHTFLNLEGAGAGGRAVLFRSSDAEVTRVYTKVSHPFGTVISADGFKRKLVRSQTDYIIFNGELGMRGLDVAFMEPRSRYHTQEDSTRYTSKDSLWHMLSTAITTVEALASDTGDEFDGPPTNDGKVSSGQGSDAVWFDLYGKVFAVFELHSFFAISVTLLLVTPLILILLTGLLVKLDKWYPFTSTTLLDNSDEPIRMSGLRGLFRTPIAFIASIGALSGLVLLIVKINPYIVYSSPYAVWSLLLSTLFAVYWFVSRGADATRPSSLQRFYTLTWMYIGCWLLLVGVTIGENNFQIAGGYFIVIYFTAVFAALLISYLELLALPRKMDYAEMIADGDIPSTRDAQPDRSLETIEDNQHDEHDERTSLLRGDRTRNLGSGYGSQHHSRDVAAQASGVYYALPRPYGKEQAWSGKLPTWTWLLQFLLLGPVPIIFVGQVALFATSALAQTPADGSSVLTVYIFFAALTVLLIAPITPFIHRFSYAVPLIIFLVAIGTLLYNLLVFPFSDQARLKVYFVQKVNLDTGINNVSLSGLSPYIDDIIASIPSANGQKIECGAPEYAARAGLQQCSWHGIPPDVVPSKKSTIPPEFSYTKWLKYTITRPKNTTTAKFHITGQNTRACRLLFDKSIESFAVKGYTTDPRFPSIEKKGCKSIRLWTREWSGSWEVDVNWQGPGGLDGKVVCLWSDANDSNAIPAYTEVLRYMPRWSVVTKLSDGLVEGYKVFKV